MEEITNEKYLGHVISNDGRNINNIKARVNKGTGIVKKILTMLDGIPFGYFYFEAAVILRDSLLASSVLCNSESWYNIRTRIIRKCGLDVSKGCPKNTKINTKRNVTFRIGAHTI